MADSGLETPQTRKRKRKDKKRKWEWTLGTDREEEGNISFNPTKTPLTALRIQDTPITAIRRGVSVSTDGSEDEGRYQPSIAEDDEEDMMARSETMTDSSEDGSSVTSAQSEPIWPSSNSFNIQADEWHTIDL